MKYIKTHEGFFSKVKDIFTKKEEPKVIDNEEIEVLLKDCFIELEDIGFEVVIESSKSNMRSMSTGAVYYDADPITYFTIYIDKEDNVDYIDFEINQIRDAVLFSMDTMMDKFGSIAECYYRDKIYTIDRGNTFADEINSFRQKGKSIKTNYSEVENSNWTISEFDIKFSIFG